MTWARYNVAGIRRIISIGVVVDDAYGAVQIVYGAETIRDAPDLCRTSFLPFQGW
jgi:hypothetical protein